MDSSTLSPTKALLLAVHLAAHADIDGLRLLASLHPTVLRHDALMRVLLTHLPETVNPATYVGLLQQSEAGSFGPFNETELDLSPVDSLSEHDASKRARRLHLAQLSTPDAPTGCEGDALALFLYQRALRMDNETGMLSQLPDLLLPFIHHSAQLRVWILSTVLPFVRRNTQFYVEAHVPYSLADFQRLPGPEAVRYLLSRTGTMNHNNSRDVARDIKGLVMPWVFDESRWTHLDSHGQSESNGEPLPVRCLGWEQLVAWLDSEARSSWDVFVSAVEHWDGPADVAFGCDANLSLPDSHLRYLSQTYRRAAVSSIYSTQVATVESLGGMYRAVLRIRSALKHGQNDLPLEDALASMPSLPVPLDGMATIDPRPTNSLKINPLQPWSPPISADSPSTGLLSHPIKFASR